MQAHKGSTPKTICNQGLKIALVRLYLQVPQAAEQVKILIFLVKISFLPYMPMIFVMQDECLFSDISRPGNPTTIPSKGKLHGQFHIYSITIPRKNHQNEKDSLNSG